MSIFYAEVDEITMSTHKSLSSSSAGRLYVLLWVPIKGHSQKIYTNTFLIHFCDLNYYSNLVLWQVCNVNKCLFQLGYSRSNVLRSLLSISDLPSTQCWRRGQTIVRAAEKSKSGFGPQPVKKTKVWLSTPCRCTVCSGLIGHVSAKIHFSGHSLRCSNQSHVDIWHLWEK